ncbi:MAG: sirohydrochlorin cobaltochelatase [Desulfatibacillaceae bacterium]
MNTPIVMAAFGTTTRAMETYEHMGKTFRARFPENEIHWAYTSRTVKARRKTDRDMSHPWDVLERLADAGHEWAVVQSLHMMFGHEFNRLVEDARQSRIRTAMGLPLLCSPEDYAVVADAVAPLFDKAPDEAVVLVGHGTDHPAWSTYTALCLMLRQRHGTRAHVGVVEGGWPGRDDILRQIEANGFHAVRLVPFMLVAGIHFVEDLAGEEDSWRADFEARGIEVRLEKEGMGKCSAIQSLFAAHAAESLRIVEAR